ncbi:MAG: hypothetical protein ACI8RZ_004211 [Myxococcota bacterium]|jgi:hypothetical protein
MICIHCNENTENIPCDVCHNEPRLERRYRLQTRIGQGATGMVYRASDERTDAALAIKEVPFRTSLDPKRQELFEREGRVLRQLSHPAIPRWLGQCVGGVGRARSLYLLQEFVEGTSLKVELEERRYTESDVLDILEELLDVLTYLHRLSPPVIHRDIKPANIMRRPNGSLALIDFGSVRDVIRDAQVGGSTVAGTFGFMAPEQFAGQATPATDLYGLGATAIALLSREDPASLHQRSGRFQWQQSVKLSAATRALLEGMVHHDPAHRPDDPRALQSRIRQIRLTGAEATPASVGPMGEDRRFRGSPTKDSDHDRALFEALSETDQALVRAETTAVSRKRKNPVAMAFMGVLLVGLFGVLVALLVLAPTPEPLQVPTPPVVVQPVVEAMNVVTLSDVTPDPDNVVPKIPDSMRGQGDFEELCKLELHLDSHGSVSGLEATEGNTCSKPLLEAAIDAASTWKFTIDPETPPAESYTLFHGLRFKLSGGK